MKKIICGLMLLLCAVTVNAKGHKHKHQVAQKPSHHKQVILHSTASVLLMNVTDNFVIENTNEDNRGSIASISKLMTVYTVLSSNQNLNEILTVENRLSNHTRLSRGMKLSRHDLIKLALIHSDNLAAQTLAENYPGGYDNFIRTMNHNAKDLLMNDTVFYDPTGLNAGNSSTLRDIIFLTNAVSQYSLVREAAQSEGVVVYAVKGKKNIKIAANPTINFFGKDGVVTVKTGFTNAAGFCITMLINVEDKLYNLVILGARSSQERKKLIERSLQAIKYT